jgi:hypothetical protein
VEVRGFDARNQDIALQALRRQAEPEIDARLRVRP